MAPERVGILGGTFDPVHYGHILPAQYAFNDLRLDGLVLVPSGPPVHRAQHRPAPAEHRLAMCRLAVTPLPRFGVSDVEVTRPEPSYTVLTLEHFRARLGPAAALFLLIGGDILSSLHTWFRLPDVLALCTLVPIRRPSEAAPDLGPLRAAVGDAAVDQILGREVPGPLIPISATEVRRRVACREPIQHLVPDVVAAYIAKHGLYRGGNA
jgi:nicotinate-nucleotide adenylyltransferase